MMKTVRFHGQGDIRLDDVEITQCGRGQVKVGTLPGVPVCDFIDPKRILSGNTILRGNMWNWYAAAPPLPLGV